MFGLGAGKAARTCHPKVMFQNPMLPRRVNRALKTATVTSNMALAAK